MNNANQFAKVSFALVLAAVTAGAFACRAHPASLAITLVGDAVDDKDIKKRKVHLLGKPGAAADAMFGRRHDTLTELGTNRQWLIYAEPGETMAESFYVAEMDADGIIVGIFKCKRNIDGLEDVYKTKKLRGRLMGKTPEECEAEVGMANPIHVMRSAVSGAVARIYDARNWSHTRGSRYCMLVFNSANLCAEIRFVGVTARAADPGSQSPAAAGP